MAEPAGIRGALQAVASGLGMESPLQTAQVFSSWARIVGPDVATKCKPTSLKGGVLKVRTESQAWASEFRYLAQEVAARINSHLGAEVVKEIKPWVGPAVKENGGRGVQSPGSLKVPPRHDIGPAVLAEVEVMAGEVADAGLSTALRRALLAAKSR